MRLRNRWFTACLLAALIAITSAACGSSGSSSGGGSGSNLSGSGKGNILIGDADDLTGDLSSYGQWALTYLRAAVDYVNAHGGVNGRKLQLITADEAAAGQSASSATHQLLNDHVQMIFGYTVSNDCDAVSSLVAAQKVPIICTSVEATDVSPARPYVFAAGVNEPQEAPASVSFLSNPLGIKSGAPVAVLNSGSGGSEEFGATVVPALQKAGYKVVSHQVASTVAGLLQSSQIAAVVAAKPQAVVAHLATPFVQPLVDALRAAGSSAPVIIADDQVGYATFQAINYQNLYGIDVSQVITDLGSTDTGVQMAADALKLDGLTTVAGVNSGLGTQAFPPDYDALEALVKCNGCSGAALDNELQSTSVSLPGLIAGTFGWTPTNHIGYGEQVLVHYIPSTKDVVQVGQPVALGPVITG
jgi:ABC-type branched-subunit amino acid transport system substrate-binding protein